MSDSVMVVNDVKIFSTKINDKWDLLLPEHRAFLPEWPVWEKERLASMNSLLEPGDIIFDVGAEEGDLPGLWASWGCDVVCFEPDPLVWPNIKTIWEANEFAPMKGWFVGFASDVTNLNPPRNDVLSTDRDGWPECAYGPVIGDHGFRHLGQQADHTPQVRIDDWCHEHGVFPTAITIDVEGSELFVLKGAESVLRDYHPKVWVSVHTDAPWMDKVYGGIGGKQVLDFMDNVGYTATHLATDHEEHWVFL